MEEVGLPQVGRRLLLEVGSSDPRAVDRTSVIILALIVIYVRFYVRTFHLFFFSPSFSSEESSNKNGIFRTKA